MKKFLVALAAGAMALTLSAATASAVIVNYNGIDYKVTTKTGTFLDLNLSSITDGTRLQDQVWWGDDTAARTFATHFGTAGQPYFATSFPVQPVLGCYLTGLPATFSNSSCTTVPAAAQFEWAVAKLTTSPATASGIVVSYNGADYDVTTKTGSFLDFIAPSINDGTRLQDQVWWGDDLVARAFAQLYGTAGQPYFAASFLFEPVLGCYLTGLPATFANSSCTTVPALAQFEWAVATRVTPVPLPAGGLLLLTGLGAAAGLRFRGKRRERAQAEV